MLLCSSSVEAEMTPQSQSGSTVYTMGTLKIHCCSVSECCSHLTPFTVSYLFLAAPIFKVGGSFIAQDLLLGSVSGFCSYFQLLAGCHSDIEFLSQHFCSVWIVDPKISSQIPIHLQSNWQGYILMTCPIPAPHLIWVLIIRGLNAGELCMIQDLQVRDIVLAINAKDGVQRPCGISSVF